MNPWANMYHDPLAVPAMFIAAAVFIAVLIWAAFQK